MRVCVCVCVCASERARVGPVSFFDEKKEGEQDRACTKRKNNYLLLVHTLHVEWSSPLGDGGPAIAPAGHEGAPP